MILAISILSIAAFAFVLYCIYQKSYLTFVLLLPYLYGMATVILSNAYLENYRTYIFEQDAYSSPNGSTLLFGFYSITGLIVVTMVMRGVNYKDTRTVANKKLPLIGVVPLVIIVLLELLLIIHVLVSGSPWADFSVTKFDFWAVSAKFKILSVFNWLLYIVIFVVGANAAYFLYKCDERLKRFLSITILVLGIIYYITWGNKFSAIVMMFFMYFVPALISNYIRNKRKLHFNITTIAYVLICLTLCLVIVIYQYTKIQTRGLDVGEQLVERVLVLQGHVWWGCVDYVVKKGPIYAHFFDEFQAMLFGGAKPGSVGMTYLMKLLAPASLFSGYIDSNVQFTAGYPAINLITFGFFGGWIVSVLGWFLFALFLKYLVYLLKSGSSVRLFLGAFIYLTAISWLAHGSPNSFFGHKLLVVAVLILILELLRYIARLPNITNTDA